MREGLLDASGAVPTAHGRAETDVKPRVEVPVLASPGFADWMLRHKVGLVCSAYFTGNLIFMGVRSNGALVLTAAQLSRCTGIAAFSQRLYVAAEREIWRLENALEPNEIADGMYDRLYVPRNAQITDDLAIHELAVEPSGRILFVNTLYS